MQSISTLSQSFKNFVGIISLCFIALSSTAQTTTSDDTLSPEDKVFGLSRFWSEVKYNFVYFDQIGETKWDSIYRAHLTNVLQTKDNQEYCEELQRMCALLKDGHTNIKYENSETITTLFDSLQWYVDEIEERAIVTGINEMNKTKIPIGTEIVKVNGMSAREYIRKYSLPLIASSTEHARWAQATNFMFQGREGQSYDVELLTPSGKNLKMRITHAVQEPVCSDPMCFTNEQNNLLELKWYPGDIAYVALNSFEDQSINKMFADVFPELKKRAKKLIIDLRHNGGGSTGIGANILKYLTSDSVLIGARSSTRVYSASHAAAGRFINPSDTTDNHWARKAYLTARGEYFEGGSTFTCHIEKEQERLVVPTVLLIDRYTASAAEDFLILADSQKHMTKIGRKTFGSTGQPIFIDLVKDFKARICTKKDTYPDGRLFVGYGVKPDIEVIPTVQDLITDKDRALQVALEHLQGGV